MIESKKTLWQAAMELFWGKPYNCFFGVLALLVFAPIFTLIPLVVFREWPIWGGVVLISLILLVPTGLLADAMNDPKEEGKSSPDSKSFFWKWVKISAAFWMIALFGYIEVKFLISLSS